MARPWLILVLALGLGPTLRADEPVPGSLSRTRIHKVRVRVLPSGSAPAGRCLQLTESDLRVTLRGQSIDTTRLVLDREPRATVHGLLIDTSDSMRGRLQSAAAAALGYLEQLEPDREAALVATFDETLQLAQSATSSRTRLEEAVTQARLGIGTSLNDSLLYMLRELEVARERPVLILLSDGGDTTSIHDRGDVLSLLGHRDDLTIFTIGYQLPPMSGVGSRPGQISMRRFLQRLAYRTDGRFFDAPTGSRLGPVYRRIREMLASEAELTVLDPDPDAPPGRLRVRSGVTGCRVEVLGRGIERDAASAEPLPEQLAFTPARRFRVNWVNAAHHVVDPRCAGNEGWAAEVGPSGLHGCALDVTMDTGSLYDPWQRAWIERNGWIRLKTRWLEVPMPERGSLPNDPVELMDELGRFALEVRDDEIGIDPRKVPREKHARPFHDFVALHNGNTFFDMRATIAQGFLRDDEYRRWVRERLAEESRRDLLDLERRFQRLVPEASASAVRRAVLASPEGRAIQARAARPGPSDAVRLLAAWHGDVSAHELFVGWEVQHLQRLLAHTGDGTDFTAQWTALRRVFFVPSYARVLTLMSPVFDPERRQVGYWRVVLPRPGWIPMRQRGYRKDPDWSNLPLDLIPDAPLAYWWLEEWLPRNRPALSARLVEGGYLVADLRYELTTKPHRQDPEQAFRATRITIRFEAPSGALAVVEAQVDLELDRRGRPRVTDLALASSSAPPQREDSARLLRIQALPRSFEALGPDSSIRAPSRSPSPVR